MEQHGLTRLEVTLGHAFRNRSVLLRALTHRSLAYERAVDAREYGAAQVAREDDNEQLEFLGDAVLGFVVAAILFKSYPGLSEGELTRLRASLVNGRHMTHVARTLDLGSFLRLGRGEERSGGRRKAALLANGMEAVIAALYLDGGIAPVQQFIADHVVFPYADHLRKALDSGAAIGDHKSALQELLQSQKSGTPEYLVTSESGPDHDKRFHIEVRAARAPDAAPEVLAHGSGSTKKKAEQEAARRAFQKLRGPGSGAEEISATEEPEDMHATLDRGAGL